eukprot:GDKJ01043092.1.p1 GENE.GDKJ01043092.1~~GDKJ01043092.1.p1  ORF type:complete len:173 (+),score=16.77 GDKJ01043092.1:54-572(+)
MDHHPLTTDSHIPAALRPWAAPMYFFSICVLISVLSFGASLALEIYSLCHLTLFSGFFTLILIDILTPLIGIYDECIGFTALSITKITVFVGTIKDDLFDYPKEMKPFLIYSIAVSLLCYVAIGAVMLLLVFFRDRILPHLPANSKKTEYESFVEKEGNPLIRYHSITEISE